LAFSGTADIKHGIFNIWAGEKYLVDGSSSAKGNVITDANPWTFCYAWQAGECRTGSSVGNLYAAIPRADLESDCWASQINLRIPCAMAGPDQAMRATQIFIAAPDPSGAGQRNLSSLLMGPGHQYVYSSVLPSPDASYLLFGGYLINGYHSAMMAAKLPSFPAAATSKTTYVPINVQGQTSSKVYVEFGYEEFGPRGSFYCTPRQASCRVTASAIDESDPFLFAGDQITPVTGTYNIAIPALPGHLVYYAVFSNGAQVGPLQVAIAQ
jgi:hypothetical protein